MQCFWLVFRSAFEATNVEHEKELKEAENRILELKRKQQQVEHELSECKVKNNSKNNTEIFLSYLY